MHPAVSNSFILIHQSFIEHTHYRGSRWKNVINELEKEAWEKDISLFARKKRKTERKGREQQFKEEFIGDISRPDDVGVAQCRLLSIPINHWRTTARTRISTRAEDTCWKFLMPRRDRHMWPQSDVLMASAYRSIMCATCV